MGPPFSGVNNFYSETFYSKILYSETFYSERLEIETFSYVWTRKGIADYVTTVYSNGLFICSEIYLHSIPIK